MSEMLARIAERMKREARAHPGVPFKHLFTNGAEAAVVVMRDGMRLRIARRGVYPPHDFSSAAAERQRKWDWECETFRRAFGVPDNSEREDGTQTIFYFRIYRWIELPMSAAQGPAGVNGGIVAAESLSRQSKGVG